MEKSVHYVITTTSEDTPRSIAWHEQGHNIHSTEPTRTVLAGISDGHFILYGDHIHEYVSPDARRGQITFSFPLSLLDAWSGKSFEWPDYHTGILTEEVTRGIGKVHSKLYRGESVGKSLLSAITLALITDLFCQSHTGKKPFAPKGKLSAAQMLKVMEYVRTSLHGEIHLSQMAGEVCLSEFHFSRLFRNSFGTSPYQFVLQMKVECAQAIMMQYPRSLSRIAHSLHFTDQAHFTNVFKKITGMCPTEFMSTQASAA